MPYSDEDFVPLQEATGHGSGVNGATVAVSLPGGTTEGMTVLIQLYVYNSVGAGVGTVAAGFTSDSGAMFRRSNVAASEAGPWNFTITVASGTGYWAWYAQEVDHLDLVDPFDQYIGNTSGTTANGATKSSNTTVAAAGSEGVAFAHFYAYKAASGDVQSWSGWTNSFAEVLESAPTTGLQVAVARKYVSGFATAETTATFATNAAAPATRTTLLIYRAAGATINAPVNYLTGFEFGTHGGMGSSAVPPAAGSPTGDAGTVGLFGTGWLVQAGSARNSGFGLQVVASATTPQVLFSNAATGAGIAKLAAGFNIRPVSATGTPAVAVLVTSSGAYLYLVYDVATERFGLRWETGGTIEYQTGTTPLNTWAWVEMAAWANSTTWHADWWIESGTDGRQTSPADLSGAAASSIYVLLGAAVSSTFTADYDDLVISKYPAAFPLGPHEVRRLVPEVTGASVSGTSGNFSKFTANGTLAAWAGDAGALLDEAPPTVSASSDGVVQTAVAASDYMNFPMTTYTLGATEIIAGVRAMASLWGGTGSGTGTLGFRGHDGTTETTFVAAGTSFDPDSLTAISATYPLWYSGMWNPGAKWTQAKLDAAALRGGFSTDATPDMGFSAMYLEVATRQTAPPVVAHRLTSDEDPEAVAATVTEQLHPYTSGVRTYTVANDDANRTAEFRFYEAGGAEHAASPVVVAPLDPPVDVTVGAEVFGEIESTSFGWQ